MKKIVIVSAMLAFSSVAFAKPTFTGNNYTGLYECKGENSSIGAYDVVVALRLNRVSSHGKFGAYYYETETVNSTVYHGQAVADGNRLAISFNIRDKKNNVDMPNDARILISMPTLKAFHVEGAGLAELNNINGDTIEIGFQGAGRLVAKGRVNQLKLNAQGVGDVDTKALLAQRANVSFEGIGAVKVYASERLDAAVAGMGSLNYYGNPKVVNKRLEGIGSVKAGG